MQPTLETNREHLKKILKERWYIEAEHWLPLSEPTTEEEIVFFPQRYFFKDFGLEQLKKIIEQLTNSKIYQWNWETRKQEFYTIEITEMVEFESLEKFYFDDSCDWIVYLSHENTIAFGGEKIIEILTEKWENWFKYLNEWETN